MTNTQCRICTLPRADRQSVEDAVVARRERYDDVVARFPGKFSKAGLSRHINRHMGDAARKLRDEDWAVSIIARRYGTEPRVVLAALNNKFAW